MATQTELPEPDLGVLLNLAFGAFKDELHRHLAAAGYDDLGGAFGYVFRQLAAGPMNLKTLAEALAISPQGALKIVEDMVQKGYVTRQEDGSDRRVKWLTLAPRGETALAAARAFHQRYEADLTAALGSTAVAQTRQILDWMVQQCRADGLEIALRPF